MLNMALILLLSKSIIKNYTQTSGLDFTSEDFQRVKTIAVFFFSVKKDILAIQFNFLRCMNLYGISDKCLLSFYLNTSSDWELTIRKVLILYFNSYNIHIEFKFAFLQSLAIGLSPSLLNHRKYSFFLMDTQELKTAISSFQVLPSFIQFLLRCHVCRHFHQAASYSPDMSQSVSNTSEMKPGATQVRCAQCRGFLRAALTRTCHCRLCTGILNLDWLLLDVESNLGKSQQQRG